MKQLASGTIHERISAIPNSWYPAYLVRGGTKNLLIHAGINLLGPLYLKSIREIIAGPNPLQYLFLTHSHYDHLGGAGYLKRQLPELTIGAHERVAGLLQKESVLEMMNRLSESQRKLFQGLAGNEDVKIRPFEIGLILKQGDEFDLGGLSCRVYEVPGHTRDSLAFFIPEIKALFPGEAAGVPQGKGGEAVQVEFLSSYHDYLKSLEMMIGLEPEMVCIGHAWVFTGSDAGDYLARSLAATARYKELIENYLDAADGDAGRAIQAIVRTEYDESGTIFQERNAYI